LIVIGKESDEWRPLPQQISSLTERELEVLCLLARGHTNKAIGRQLQITLNTVNNHVQNILRKLGVANRTAAACWAVSRGLIDDADSPYGCESPPGSEQGESSANS